MKMRIVVSSNITDDKTVQVSNCAKEGDIEKAVGVTLSKFRKKFPGNLPFEWKITVGKEP